MFKIQLKDPEIIKACEEGNWLQFRYSESDSPVRPTRFLLPKLALMEIAEILN